MINSFVIKFDRLYFDKYSGSIGGSYTKDVWHATKYVTAATAEQEIKEMKMGDDHKVFQVNVTELEVKS